MATRPQWRPSVLGQVSSVVVERLDGYPINTRRCVMEHRGALSSRIALGQPFEDVMQDVIGVEHLINQPLDEFAFTHGTHLLSQSTFHMISPFPSPCMFLMWQAWFT
jgi:hypothetical protein